jgi:hypothetical protein
VNDSVIVSDAREDAGTFFVGTLARDPVNLRVVGRKLSSAALECLRNQKALTPLERIVLSMHTRFVSVGPRVEALQVIKAGIERLSRDNKPVEVRLSRENVTLAKMLERALGSKANIVSGIERPADFRANLASNGQSLAYRKICSNWALVVGALIIAGCWKVAGALGIARWKPTRAYWMSFANNRDVLDYKFIRDSVSAGLSLSSVVPIPSWLSRRYRNVPSAVQLLAHPDIQLKRLAALLIATIFRSNKALDVALYHLAARSTCVLPRTAELSADARAEFQKDLIFNVLHIAFYEALAASQQGATLVFRGGNVAGMFYAGAELRSHLRLVHMCHGTEVLPSNHVTDELMHEVFLPSDGIVQLWRDAMPEHADVALVATGRLDYEYSQRVIGFSPIVAVPARPTVVIVLTYGAESEMVDWIAGVAQATRSVWPQARILVKQRPNRRVDLSSLIERFAVEEASGNIYDVLKEGHVVVSGISDRGMISMVFFDAILYGIRSFLYLPGLAEVGAGYTLPNKASKLAVFDQAALEELFVLAKQQLAPEIQDAERFVRDLLGPTKNVGERIRAALAADGR